MGLVLLLIMSWSFSPLQVFLLHKDLFKASLESKIHQHADGPHAKLRFSTSHDDSLNLNTFVKDADNTEGTDKDVNQIISALLQPTYLHQLASFLFNQYIYFQNSAYKIAEQNSLFKIAPFPDLYIQLRVFRL